MLAVAESAEEAHRVDLAGGDGVVLEGEFTAEFDAPGLDHAIRLPVRDRVLFASHAP